MPFRGRSRVIEYEDLAPCAVEQLELCPSAMCAVPRFTCAPVSALVAVASDLGRLSERTHRSGPRMDAVPQRVDVETFEQTVQSECESALGSHVCIGDPARRACGPFDEEHRDPTLRPKNISCRGQRTIRESLIPAAAIAVGGSHRGLPGGRRGDLVTGLSRPDRGLRAPACGSWH